MCWLFQMETSSYPGLFAIDHGNHPFFSDWWKAIKWAQANGGDVVVWASKCTIGLESSCQTMGVRLIRMEDGFIRSVGVGFGF